MKLHKKCPECKSSEIYTTLVSARGGYSQFYVPEKMLGDVQKNFVRAKHVDASH